MARRSTVPEPPTPRPLCRLLTIDQLASYLQIPRQTIYYWRTRGEGPAAVSVGRHIRFREDDVSTWLDARDSAAA